MRKGFKRSTISYIIVSCLSLLVVGSVFIAAYILTVKSMKMDYDVKLTKAQEEINANKRTVYTAIADIAAGDPIVTENLKKDVVFASQPQELYMTEDDIGKIALVDINAGTQIVTSMLTEGIVSNEVREVEYEVIMINSNIIDNDFVDVRIMFPNGEDFIVLSKKVIKGITMDSGTCFLWLSEEEILRMASAIVDAFLYNGAKIYTTKYIEPNLQEASLITYEPSLATQLLIKDNPNILQTAINELSKQVRKAMENRMAASLNINVEEIEWELDPNEIAEAASQKANEKRKEEAEKKEETKKKVETEQQVVIEQEIPESLNVNENVTYKDELKDREAEMDYGP